MILHEAKFLSTCEPISSVQSSQSCLTLLHSWSQINYVLPKYNGGTGIEQTCFHFKRTSESGHRFQASAKASKTNSAKCQGKRINYSGSVFCPSGPTEGCLPSVVPIIK